MTKLYESEPRSNVWCNEVRRWDLHTSRLTLHGLCFRYTTVRGRDFVAYLASTILPATYRRSWIDYVQQAGTVAGGSLAELQG